MEDNKQNERENRGKKTVSIFAFNSPSRECLAQILFKRSEFRLAELFAFKALLIFKHVWNLKDNNINFRIIWKILKQATAYNPSSKLNGAIYVCGGKYSSSVLISPLKQAQRAWIFLYTS